MNNMHKKIIPILVSMLFIFTSFSITVFAGSEEDPEIEDEVDSNVVDYLDIISAWFYEESNQPDYLFVCLKVKQIEENEFKQKLTVHWEYQGIECAAGVAIGFEESVYHFSAGWGHGFWFQEHYQKIEGSIDEEKGIITFKIPKEYIKDPQEGDVLTNTYALTFVRIGFLGKIGFDRHLLSSIISLFVRGGLTDAAPDSVRYGRDYIIQY